MGRRKIEIQPITHERNRSVTFLKRKNGLFKKAYELGVLCSVDVAVIIFEERPGHQLKLYQYCSSDIHDIVQRHVRYDGEQDTRTPNDFSGNTKLDDTAEVDEDEVDEEEPEHQPAGNVPVSKRRGDSRIKPELVSNGGIAGGNSPMNVDKDYNSPHRPMSIPHPPLSVSHLMSSNGGSSSIPISGERLTSSSVPSRAGSASGVSQYPGPNKKARTTANVNISNTSRSSVEDVTGPGGSFNYQTPSTLRQSQQQNPQFNPFFGLSAPPPSNFMPNPFEFPHPTSSSRVSIPRGNNFPPRASSFQDQSQPIYQQMLRQSPSQPAPSHQPVSSTVDLFAAFLDGDEARQGPGQGQSQSFGTLDWPVHVQGSGQRHDTDVAPNPSNDTNWLDFLSTSAATAQDNNHLQIPHSSVGAGNRMSWERGQEDDLFTVERSSDTRPASREDRPPSSTGTAPRTSSKRSRASSVAGSVVPSVVEADGGGTTNDSAVNAGSDANADASTARNDMKAEEGMS